MQQESLEPSDGPYPSDRTPDSEASDDNPPADGEIARFPAHLLNWHVVEIEGEATLIEETEITDANVESVTVSPPVLASEIAPQIETRISSSIRDQLDELIGAEMQSRRLVVMPGETATFEVTVVNHGRWSALFEVTLEGWIDEAWTPDLPQRVQLEPGARQVVILPIVPPRQSDCRAGDHALAVVVRAARYPGHSTQLAATLSIERFASLKLGTPQPHEVDLSWFVPAATLRLPITNQSNFPATIHLQGMDHERHCDFTFYTDGSGSDGSSSDGSSIDDGIMGTARLTLQPGQTVSVPVEVRARQRPLIGLMPRMITFRLVARMDTEPPLRRAVDGELALSALIVPWQMAIAGVLGVVAVFGTGLAGLALLVALRSMTPTNSAPQVMATPVPAAPVVAFVIQMDQQMPTRVPSLPNSALPAQSAPQEVPQSAPEVSNEAPLIPIIGADQVTAPGEPTPEGQRPLRPLVVTQPNVTGPNVNAPSVTGPRAVEATSAESAPPQANNSNLTYGAMFKDVASQFDLDWRLLAAQAYLESGFDSLALSGQGDMGLMQIRPGTWNEWAPTVEASDPFDSYSNVLVGAAYLNHLREQLSARGFPQEQWMLVAFNWGPDKVFSHLDAGGTWETLELERRQYADDILRIAESIPSS